MFKTLLILTPILVAAALPAAGAGTALDLESVLEAVRQGDPVLKAARARAGEADGMALSAYAWMPPKAGA